MNTDKEFSRIELKADCPTLIFNLPPAGTTRTVCFTVRMDRGFYFSPSEVTGTLSDPTVRHESLDHRVYILYRAARYGSEVATKVRQAVGSKAAKVRYPKPRRYEVAYDTENEVTRTLRREPSLRRNFVAASFTRRLLPVEAHIRY